jgi:hypothetical protein
MTRLTRAVLGKLVQVPALALRRVEQLVGAVVVRVPQERVAQRLGGGEACGSIQSEQAGTQVERVVDRCDVLERLFGRRVMLPRGIEVGVGAQNERGQRVRRVVHLRDVCDDRAV